MKINPSPAKLALVILFSVVTLSAVVFAGEPPIPADPSGKKDIGATVERSYDADAMRVQGEQRFHANCGRCHAAPQKFPPRMMATVLRHMRVRATITDQDMRLVLFYMTQ